MKHKLEALRRRTLEVLDLENTKTCSSSGGGITSLKLESKEEDASKLGRKLLIAITVCRNYLESFVADEVVSAAEEIINAATITEDGITLAQALAKLKSVKPKLEQEKAKKQKVDGDKEIVELQSLMKVIPDEEEFKAVLAFIQMLRSFDREDLETLWKLVKAKHGYTRPEEGYERVLWGDLKIMFEHHVEDTKRYPLTPATITEMLNKKLQADH
ncbi:hypothetical protein Tco_1003622 [Tanacetum coccineum]|uniref:Uncharacterized protein n=1 Tax=Tanacetum coccineum TaxID=301880 RepID=A0ABQ5FA78_9ASTR